METKTILVLSVLNIALPTLDTVTDINLVYKLYRGAGDRYIINHPRMASAMLTPFLLNYFVCFITFLRKEKNKKFTFIFALLNIYPQFGMDNHKREIIEKLISIFRSRQDNLPPGQKSIQGERKKENL